MIEDAAHAIGTVHQGKRVGGFGDIACFSFDGIKNITSGEGGCIVTEDTEVLRKVRDARLLGVESDTERRYVGQRSWEFDVRAQGWRYHMSNIMAAIGIVQLKRLPALGERRRMLARRYDCALENQARIVRLPLDYGCVVPHIYVVRIQGLSRRTELRERLLASGVQSVTHYRPNHTLSFYRDDSALPLPVTEEAAAELLSLPPHPDMLDEDVDIVCSKLLECLREM